MKVFVTVICILMATTAFAGDNVAFWGGTWDEGPYLITGHGINIDGGLWSFQYTYFGQDQSVNLEVAYLASVNDLVGIFGLGGFGDVGSKLFLGPIAGPYAEWIDTEEDDMPTIAYLNGAAGALLTYNIYGDNIFAWSAAKYKFAFEDNTYAKDGWKAGLGIGYSF